MLTCVSGQSDREGWWGCAGAGPVYRLLTIVRLHGACWRGNVDVRIAAVLCEGDSVCTDRFSNVIHYLWHQQQPWHVRSAA